ncbi:unnamed protein product, partial [Gulo gulo]
VGPGGSWGDTVPDPLPWPEQRPCPLLSALGSLCRWWVRNMAAVLRAYVREGVWPRGTLSLASPPPHRLCPPAQFQ